MAYKLENVTKKYLAIGFAYVQNDSEFYATEVSDISKEYDNLSEIYEDYCKMADLARSKNSVNVRVLMSVFASENSRKVVDDKTGRLVLYTTLKKPLKRWGFRNGKVNCE